MTSHLRAHFAFSFVLLFMVGCSTGPVLTAGPSGANPIAKHTKDENGKPIAVDHPVDLIDLIGGVENQSQWLSLEAARREFSKKCTSAEHCVELRNQVQDRLIWASESACSDYMRSVRQSFTSTNLNLGGATTFFGALGSILTSTDATRVMAGTAGFLSGLRAEYNDVYFNSQAFELISKSVRAIREKSLKTLYDSRANKSILQYTLEASIADAMRYHSTCSVVAGIEEASEAVTRDRDPGLKRMGELLQGVGATVNFSLGTTAIDASGLPSASRLCPEIKRIYTESDRVMTDVKSVAPEKVADADTHRKNIEEIYQSSTDDCLVSTGAIAKAEREMYDEAREFPAKPLSDKPIAKAKFEAAKANVQAYKVKLEQLVLTARQNLSELSKYKQIKPN